MKISTAATKIMCLSKHPVFSNKWNNSPADREVVTFLSDSRQDNELDTGIEKASAVMNHVYRSVVLKKQLCTRAKFLFSDRFLFLFFSTVVSVG